MTLQTLQRNLRKNQTGAERRLWFLLRKRSFLGFKFRPQYVVQGYIVDFICFEKKIIIELDGGQHTEQQQYDNERTRVLEQEGFKVIRFWNFEVFTQTKNVLDAIYFAMGIEDVP